MLMNNAPPTINLSETHGQSKFELFPLAIRVDARASPCRRSEGHAFPGGDFHVVKVKGDWLLGPRQKRFPGRHVGIQPSRQEWRWHVKHQHLGVVVRANPGPVLFATALAHFSISVWMSISSWDEGSCRLLIVIVLSPCNLNEKAPSE
jgi:hypothetical protein